MVITNAQTTPILSAAPNDAMPLYEENTNEPNPHTVVRVVNSIAFPTLENR